MLKHAVYFSVLFSLLIIAGCGSGNPEAPAGGDAHPANWIALHGAEAITDLRGCQGCHGFDFNGSGAAVSCFNCHVSGPPFTIHPAVWTNVVADHQGFAQDLSWTSCSVAICHGTDLQGGNGPTCFNGACHPNTLGDPPAPASHQGVDFTLPVNHGVLGRVDQHTCIHCHGRDDNTIDGGFISDPAIMNNLDFNGVAVFGNCRVCHPDAGAHPTNWQGSNDIDLTYAASHRGVDLATQSRSCALCHSVSGPGIGAIPDAPSCFATTHTNSNLSLTNCHPNGPRTAPHAIDGSYQSAAAHGKDAKLHLTDCQSCHADQPTSGPGSNPRFNAPIGNLANGCESCHAAFYAHPTNWAGPNATFHYSSGDVANACTLCHGTALNGVGGINAAGGTPGQSCRDCHAETTAFTLDCNACHGYPPDGVTAEPLVGGILVNHNNTLNAASADVSSGSAGTSHDTCVACHGVKATGAVSGDFSAAAAYTLFNPITDTQGDHWDGRINMNGPSGTGTGYDPTNFGCDNAGCHGNDANHQLSNSGLTVAFGDYGTGGATHAVDGSFLLGSAHGPVARSDLAACKACHGEATNIDPLFNVGINVAGGNGCEGCHNPGTAHPSANGINENINWYDVTWRHSPGSISAATCGMCHPGGAGWAGSVGTACTSCHVSDPANDPVGTCDSCHEEPPNGNAQPNRRGEHSKGAHQLACDTCHTNDGPGSADHFTRPSPGFARADLLAVPINVGVTSMTMTVTPTNVTCANSCHGKNHDDKSWY